MEFLCLPLFKSCSLFSQLFFYNEFFFTSLSNYVWTTAVVCCQSLSILCQVGFPKDEYFNMFIHCPEKVGYPLGRQNEVKIRPVPIE